MHHWKALALEITDSEYLSSSIFITEYILNGCKSERKI